MVIFGIGILRDTLCVFFPLPAPLSELDHLINSDWLCSYERALRDQPALDILQTDTVKVAAAGLFLTGNVLVLTSMWALGLTGTYLGT